MKGQAPTPRLIRPSWIACAGWRVLTRLLASVALLTICSISPCPAQNFRITKVQVDPTGKVDIHHESSIAAYFILLQGPSPSTIQQPVAMALGSNDLGGFSVPLPSSGDAFFRIRSIPQGQPLDSDGDGVDDVYELLHPSTLDPLNSADALTRIRETSPVNGESSVAVTRETVFRLTRALSADAVISSQRLFAQFGGRRLLSRVETSSDRKTITLFYLEPLPASARVQVTFDGNGLNDSLGRPLDLDGDATSGGTAQILFQTLSLTTIPGTIVCGRVFASELAPGNDPAKSVNVPLAGVTVTVDGLEETMRAVTDQLGDFRLDPAPVGEFFVHIDGRTATNTIVATTFPEGPYYPFVGKQWESVAGEEVNIGNIYLPLVTGGTLQPVSLNQETLVTFPQSVLQQHPELSGVSIIVPSNALYSDNGARGGRVGIAPVPADRLPGPLPPGVNPAMVITVQTDGASNFDAPVPACFPNLPDPKTGQVLPPGAKAGLMSFNHDLGDWEIVGSMTVSADGKLVCTDPGAGIRQPGWHGSVNGSQGCCGNKGEGDPNAPGGGKGKPGEGEGDKGPEGEDGEKPDGNPNTPCNVTFHNGEEYFDVVDLSIPGRGEVHFTLERRYRSRIVYNGPLGHSWDFNYNSRLYPQPNGDVLRMNGFGQTDPWVRQADGTFSAPPGYFSTLIQRPDGTYVLREPDGFKKCYRTDGRLYRHQDRNGNTMLFEYDAQNCLDRVIDAFGREIDFTFEPRREGGELVYRLARVRDFAGREVVYTYDERGDLIAVRSPVVTGTSTGNDFPNGRTERYAYSSGFADERLNHNILTRTLPEEAATGGSPAFQWTYGTKLNTIDFDRVIARTRGGTNATGIAAGGQMTLKYEELNAAVPPGDLDVPRLKVTHTDPGGNVTEHYFNERNFDILTRRLTRGFRVGEPPHYETRSFYDADGQLVRRIFPEGNEIRYRYGTGNRAADRNLVETRRVAGPRSGGEDIVTTFTYEPLYNQLGSSTDPRGNAKSFVPPIGAASPERYTTRIFFDYQESSNAIPDVLEFNLDISGVRRGLGDLNSDGRTDQSSGNVVRTEAPSVLLLPDSREAERLGSQIQRIVAETQWNDRGQVVSSIDAEGNVTDYFYYPENDPDGDGTTTFTRFLTVSSQPRGYLHRVVHDGRNSTRRTTAAPLAAIETANQYDEVGNVIAVRNPRGVVTKFELNALNEVVTTVRGADVTEAIASKQLLTEEAPLQYRTRNYYDFNGRVVKAEVENRDSTTPGVGDWIESTSTYDILGNVLQTAAEVDATTSIITQFRYTPNEQLSLVIQPEGNQVRTLYDERDLPLQITRGFGSPEASTISRDYDRNGNLLRETDAEDTDGDGQKESTLTTFDGFDRISVVTDPLGNRSLIAYDVAGNIVSREEHGHPPAGAGTGPEVRYSQDLFTFDELKRCFRVDHALFTPLGFSSIRSVSLPDQDGNGFVTERLEYDALGRKVADVEDDGQTLIFLFDGANRQIAIVDAYGNRTITEYDKNSNRTRVRSEEHSPEGLVATEQYATTYVYDQLNRLVRITDNAGQTARFRHDSRGNAILSSDAEGPSVVDPLGLHPGPINGPGNTRRYVFDGVGRLIQQVCDLRTGGRGDGALDTSSPHNPDGQIDVSYEFDRNSRRTAIVDDRGNRTTFGYDALDRQVSQTLADGSRQIVEFDRDNNLRRMTDPNGSIRLMSYDANNRVLRCDVTPGAGVVGTTVETFAYDGLDRIVRATGDNDGAPNSIAVIERDYDSFGRLTEERQDGRPISNRWTGDGNRTQVVYPGGRTIGTSYDRIDRIKTISDENDIILTNSWIGGEHRLLERAFRNGTRLTYLNAARTAQEGYDTVLRPYRERVMGPNGAAMVDREYGYNRSNVRTYERRRDDLGFTDKYAYDSAHRLTETHLDEEAPGASPRRQIAKLAYEYDGVGNRRTVATTNISTLSASAQQYGVNAVNEYTSVTTDGGPPVALTYDKNGNLTGDALHNYKYDFKDRLVDVIDKTSSAPVAHYDYDHADRRIRRTLYDRGVPRSITEVVRYLWDGTQVVEELNGAGATTQTFVWGEGFDELIEVERTPAHPLGAGAYFAHQNARGDVVALSDSTGQLIERYRYDDFGNQEILDPGYVPRAVSVAGNTRQFQGLQFDAETGFSYARARYYDPQTGRFVQRDPVWDAGNLGNEYAFVGNSPISRSDPRGTFWNPLDPAGLGQKVAETAYCMVDSLSKWVGDLYNNWRAVEHAMDEADRLRKMNLDDPFEEALLQMYRRDVIHEGMDDLGVLTKQAAEAYIEVWGSMAGAARFVPNGAGPVRFGSSSAARPPARGSPPNLMNRGCQPSDLACFLAGTLVIMADEEGNKGTKRIEDIVEGDLVLSREEHSGEEGFKEVTELFRGQTGSVVCLTVAELTATPQCGRRVEHICIQSIACTQEHPFWVVSEGWVPAGRLKLGDLLLGSDGNELQVVAHEIHAETAEQFNLKIDGWRTYFVTGDADTPGLWVHNRCRNRQLLRDAIADARLTIRKEPRPGEFLYLGRYGESYRANRRSGFNRIGTPDHIIQDAVNPFPRSRGTTLNLLHEQHAIARTTSVRVQDLPSLRHHLAADIRDRRRILMNDGHERRLINQQLRKVIEQNRTDYLEQRNFELLMNPKRLR